MEETYFRRGFGLKAEVKGASDDFFKWAESALDKVAQYGAEKVREGDVVFMYSMSSTVWRILRVAKKQGKNFSVVVTESRPSNEGLWTVREMAKSGIPVSVRASVRAAFTALAIPKSARIACPSASRTFSGFTSR